jgi:hypothetical protein
MSMRKRILIGLGISVVVIGIYLWFFGFQTAVALMVRYQYRNLPDVAKTPVALSDLSISSVAHKKVSYGGYEFELPWDDIDEQKYKTGTHVHISYFHSGNIFWFSSSSPKELVTGLMGSTKLDPQAVRQIYGDEALQSDYNFKSKVFLITPSEITPFTSRKKAAVGCSLLVLKAITMPKADTGIFSIRTFDFQGFQFGSPQSRPFAITEELYSKDGGINLLIFQNVVGSTPSISQPEINRIIQSIHKVPAPVVPPHANALK